MNKKANRFWYLLNYQDLLTKEERKELCDLYDELYEYFDEDALEYIALVW